MKVIKTNINEVLIIEPRIFKDNRGYFFESFSARKFEEFNGMGYGVNFVIPKMSEFSTVIGCALSAFN